MIANVSPSISTRKNLDSATKSNCLDACESFYCEHRCAKIDFDIQVVWWAPILISYYVDRGHPIPNLVHTPAAKKKMLKYMFSCFITVSASWANR
ncbi:hypothetical protein ES288_A01G197600v1 [Gossypium darwinii]|uniref:Uncharacterized protein n=1 Tax=Gossypium darwinii TaxID=34276 RepID=A0A5D2HP78_GOSDA|nr:hypothetical protein ES288_A01G197600v1 [Gossypium darwinii]